MVAAALSEWVPKVIQAVKPFYSPDMQKGAQWSTQIDSALEGTSFGIVVLSPENLEKTWINFEAGALSKLGNARVWTLLIGLRPQDVAPPLGKFQATVAEKPDVRKLLSAINEDLEVPLSEALLDDAFEARWEQLAEAFRAASSYRSSKPSARPRDTATVLEELVGLIRGQDRRLEVLEAKLDSESFRYSLSPGPSVGAEPRQGGYLSLVLRAETSDAATTIRTRASDSNLVLMAETLVLSGERPLVGITFTSELKLIQLTRLVTDLIAGVPGVEVLEVSPQRNLPSPFRYRQHE